ncbi:uncharacterized membrane protein YozB (DUF420 family) [Thermocatellispora tengchongensis]|uniref:Uncharacterized membrane protein YozB (DUF420 family) n=1 Tax=Thermocatellispora tengchongensis TaxID=1073253 RepID=A0A840PE38_9ACTN|nr:DUF2306 domain-containing protein [Thermocatellispora tengchongensis]MBB5135407.1 uncharacterized membrane protein YozB (DUF420 family) [Thermocatellispora tengchongensis]
MTDEGGSARAGWHVPVLLIALGAVPMVAGALRLTELTLGAQVMPDNPRVHTAALPLVLHIVSVMAYTLLGAFQFAPGLRRRRPGRHRAAGRLLVPCGLLAALSGIWLALFSAGGAHDGPLLAAFRLGFGSIMALSLLLGLAAILRRDVARHRAWMIRGYAIGLGAGTQALVIALWYLVTAPAGLGAPGETALALLHAAAWTINLAVAERIVRAARRGRTRARVAA